MSSAFFCVHRVVLLFSSSSETQKSDQQKKKSSSSRTKKEEARSTVSRFELSLSVMDPIQVGLIGSGGGGAATLGHGDLNLLYELCVPS